ncbi:MAG: N-6 DNA methylase [Candidatus Micrarchaeota archaeon]|nr:N-6 DNA methylase [Candidatus Micrarchaeota archaeon]
MRKRSRRESNLKRWWIMSNNYIQRIFSPSEVQYGLSLFSKKELDFVETLIVEKEGRLLVKCQIKDIYKPAKPEEIVRQLWIKKLIEEYSYPTNRIAVEKEIWFGSGVHEKSADIVVFQKDMENPYIIIEVKKPNRKDGLEQLKSYCNAEGSPIGVWSNGSEVVILHREEPNVFTHISDLPTVDQSLQDVITEPWTIKKLTEENKLVRERLSLKSIIQDLEDLVLANAGVDAFEEVFKLIYAKLYDEWAAENQKDRKGRIFFRIYGESPNEIFEKISNLFEGAKDKWKGVFQPMDRIELSPNHLMTCVSFLQDIELFNSNLQVIDEAFEYLVTQVSKGSKGQYFTPRHVIDMAVKMLNPKEYEWVIDTASGSCGFTVHTIFWVWGNEFTAKGPTREQAEYASTHVFGLDFDPRAVKIAKALNLIAGDGKTNVYKCNSLDPASWNDEVKAALKPMLSRFSDSRQKDEDNQKNFKYFDFDVLLTNPPFAGEVKERAILKNYLLAEKQGKTVPSQGRDILFIERNLDMLKNGGRMTIVLPQGRFNNSSDAEIRKFIMERARILAVVSLHVNTFRPHTSTKTSVLFLQKWDNKLCPKKEDYPIFFAISEKPGKDNGGDPVYKRDSNGNIVIDKNGHLVLEHDLDEIADKFKDFANKEKLSFWRD